MHWEFDTNSSGFLDWAAKGLVAEFLVDTEVLLVVLPVERICVGREDEDDLVDRSPGAP